MIVIFLGLVSVSPTLLAANHIIKISDMHVYEINPVVVYLQYIGLDN